MDIETFEKELKPLLVRAHEEDRIFRFTYWTQAIAPCGQKVIEVEIEWRKDTKKFRYAPELLIKPLKDAETAISADQLLCSYKGKVIDGPCRVYAPYIPVTNTGEVMEEDIMDITREICGAYRY